MKIKPISFRGTTFQICYTDHWGDNPNKRNPHPSWCTFDDEVNVRESKWLIEPGDCVFDVGACFGSYTLTALAAGAEHVVAWSPQGLQGDNLWDADYLFSSLKLNGWESKCEVCTFGLYDRDGWLNEVTQEFSESELPRVGDVLANDIIKVTSMDHWIAPKLDWYRGHFKKFWLKIDVEGAEVEVLKGALNCISVLKPMILTENHIDKRSTIEQEVRDVLLGIGYKEISTDKYHQISHSLYGAV